MHNVLDEVDHAAKTDAKVLITGESGVGKEVVAQLLHQRSRRSQAKLIAINCAGVPDSLLASELFGHVRGSFTDAYRDKQGWLEQAHRGTIFMDEIGEMSSQMQALLLRFLESGEIQRVGSNASTTVVDVRIIAATNRTLDRSHRDGRVPLGSLLPAERDSHRGSAAARAARGHPAAARSLPYTVQRDVSHRAAACERRRDRAIDSGGVAGQRAPAA